MQASSDPYPIGEPHSKRCIDGMVL